MELKTLMDYFIDSNLTPNQRMVLLVINMAQGDRISYTEIGKQTCLSNATVARLLAQLKQLGWVNWIPATKSDTRPNKYHIQIPKELKTSL